MCTYHGWTYSLDGALVGVPGYEERYHGDLDHSQWGLITVSQVASYKGLLFGTFDREAPPLAEYLGEARWALDYTFDRRANGIRVVNAGSSNVAFGYYRLYTNSNVRAYLQGNGYTGQYFYWTNLTVSRGSGIVSLN
jgi:phenylpropionate dioxygenase-like ring-hydroxylating dioxygenase large terminal subunit